MLQGSMPKPPKRPRGRPVSPEGAMRQIAIRLPEALLARIDGYSKRVKRKRSDVFRITMEEKMDKEGQH